MNDVLFAELLETSQRHRDEHDCGAYPYDKGSLLATITAAVAPSRIVEVGTGIGYTAVCMASAAPDCRVDTIDADQIHVDLATTHFEQYGVAARATAHGGQADDVLPECTAAGYDLAFFDGYAPTLSILTNIERVLRPGGTFVCANLTLGADGDAFLGNTAAWHTHSFGETAIAVKR